MEGGGARAAALARGGEPRERLESSSAPLGELGSWLERFGREDLRRPSVGDAVGENDQVLGDLSGDHSSRPTSSAAPRPLQVGLTRITRLTCGVRFLLLPDSALPLLADAPLLPSLLPAIHDPSGRSCRALPTCRLRLTLTAPPSVTVSRHDRRGLAALPLLVGIPFRRGRLTCSRLRVPCSRGGGVRIASIRLGGQGRELRGRGRVRCWVVTSSL